MIDFLKYKWLYLTISLVVILPGLYALVNWGLKPSIDFVGGTVIEIKSTELDIESFQKQLEENQAEIESIRKDTDVLTARLKPIDRSVWEKVKSKIASESGLMIATGSAELENEILMEATSVATLEELRFETVGPVLGKELLTKTLIAAAIAIVAILIYIAWVFKSFVYGVSAIVALFHDMLVVIGAFSLFGYFYNVEVDVLFVTAILTTMSFSVHDTIVVFDRIRESQQTEKLSFYDTINKALTETMTRSVNNSMTIIFMLLALALLGGDTIKWFAVALLIGTISGTYSSPFVATPVLYTLKKFRNRKNVK